MTAAAIVFWVFVGLLAYTYVGYFVVLSLLAPVVRVLRRPHQVDDQHLPAVTMVISLHNEERLIGQRIDNFEALDYPPENLELLLGDDCSTDRTRPVIRTRMAQNPRIKLVEFNSHQGKTAVINQLVPQARGELVAFSDANTFWKPDALRHLVRHCADPRVGSVCGHMSLQDPAGRNPEDGYWRAESTVKMRENDLGVLLGANGGIYLMRKQLFRPLEWRVIQIDDFIWPLRVYEHGCIGVYERAAVATEEVSPTVEAEFRRKVRIGTGDYRSLRECWRLLLPWQGWVAFVFWSHKVIRWVGPFLLVAVLVLNAFLLGQPAYRLTFGLQLAFYGCALLGWAIRKQDHLLAHWLRLPYYFVGSNVALVIGFFKCISGRQRAAWSQKAHRDG